jgi:hypothetical protein
MIERACPHCAAPMRRIRRPLLARLLVPSSRCYECAFCQHRYLRLGLRLLRLG